MGDQAAPDALIFERKGVEGKRWTRWWISSPQGDGSFCSTPTPRPRPRPRLSPPTGIACYSCHPQIPPLGSHGSHSFSHACPTHARTWRRRFLPPSPRRACSRSTACVFPTTPSSRSPWYNTRATKPRKYLLPATTRAHPPPPFRSQDPAAGRAALAKLQPQLKQYADCVSQHLKARPMARAAAVYTANPEKE